MKKLTVNYTNGRTLSWNVNDVQESDGKLYISEIASCGIAEANIITLNPEYIASYEVK